jgi:hypothetical protein
MKDMQGQVVWYDPNRGFGFVRGDERRCRAVAHLATEEAERRTCNVRSIRYGGSAINLQVRPIKNSASCSNRLIERFQN